MTGVVAARPEGTAAHPVRDAGTASYTETDFDVPEPAAARIERSVPTNTRTAYGSRWRSFEAWCGESGRVALPATAQTVAVYLDHLATTRGCSAATLDAHLATVRTLHRAAGHPPPDPIYARKVIVDRAREQAADPTRAHGPRKALPLTVAQLRAIVDGCDLATGAGLRDRAVLLLGFALLARRAELAALNLTDVHHAPGQGLVVVIRSSKTDQGARGVVRYVHTAADPALCPVRAVLEWSGYLTGQEIHAGPLFTRVDRWGHAGARCGGRYGADTRDGRLRPQAIGDLISAAARRAGLDDAVPADGARAYTGHSLRRGGATTMLATGAAPLEVSRHGRWADGSRSFAGYIEEAHGFGDSNPTKGLL